MEEDIREFTKRKKTLVLKILHMLFEDECMKYVKEGEWDTIDELDKWFDMKLKEHDELTNAVGNYYNNKIYS